MINYSGLSRPKSVAAPTDPIEIFKKTPNLGQAPNDLWKGQAEALSHWNEHRKDADNVIILNTGAGKSIVGVLIAQSLVNEQVGPVVYACSTIDLVLQTERECERIGIKNTTRTTGAFNNDLFETGKAFCITTYASLFASINVFRGDKAPAAVIFDDAHVAERLVRDAFTVTIAKSKHPALFKDLVDILRPEFDGIGKLPHLNFVLDDVGLRSVTMAPPATAFRNAAAIREAFKRNEYGKHIDLKFAVIQLFEHIQFCSIYISSDTIEITPPFIPTGHFDFLQKGVRRVYLSATLDYDADFIRGFGVTKTTRTEPDNDAGNGERLILLASDFEDNISEMNLAASLAGTQKVLVASPSYSKAKKWEKLVSPPTPAEFSEQLNIFRKKASGMFSLVSRVDGIDLPQDTCRIMMIDGAPTGSSLMERFLFDVLLMNNLFSIKLGSRITQLFGRINRGRSDYGAYIVCGRDLNIWLKNERNIALLPELLRKQVMLGQNLQRDLGKTTQAQAVELVGDVLGRKTGWLDYYRETIDGLEVSQEAANKVRERETALAIGAKSECEFMSALWNGDVEGARKAIINVLNEVAVVDPRLAGWYSVWLGMTYEVQGDNDTAGTHYNRARSRLTQRLNLPFRAVFESGEFKATAQNDLHRKLLLLCNQGPQALADFVAKLRAESEQVLNPALTSNQHEEALRRVGERLGFETSRPDNDHGAGPDVVWSHEKEKYLLAFELKTKKDNPAEYTKTEIGQCHNHVEWIKANYPGFNFDGILIVGPDGTCADNASPSADMWLTTPQRFVNCVKRFCARVDDVRGGTAVAIWTSLNELGQLHEWQLPGIFAQLKERRVHDMRG
ncbi:DEAD/DEAH box helicase family protein [Sinorhizobium meliloti]|uniref:DEAD/DEAH box helicase family protein n=1 Tax=Rhizobium meliloti TaxID=382 RepID=UPI0013E3665E|nr:DEAD/DEAH box helicase family protein [Sinorhizobium meliloti]WQP19756.1 DEAD/DEAH box helicase family protein [Sinorhizobium meliloti]